MTKLTAETITDDQIRALADRHALAGRHDLVTECFRALGPSDMFWGHQQPTEAETRAARQRCADAINATRAERIAALAAVVGDDGTGDLGIIVDHAPADATTDDLAEIVRDARQDAAEEDK